MFVEYFKKVVDAKKIIVIMDNSIRACSHYSQRFDDESKAKEGEE